VCGIFALLVLEGAEGLTLYLYFMLIKGKNKEQSIALIAHGSWPMHGISILNYRLAQVTLCLCILISSFKGSISLPNMHPERLQFNGTSLVGCMSYLDVMGHRKKSPFCLLWHNAFSSWSL
jgi:hypothetical protein